MICPICGREIDTYWELNVSKPFVATNPTDGLTVWGPYDAPKKVLCFNGKYVHFQFGNVGACRDERLVHLLKGELREPIVMCPKCKGEGMIKVEPSPRKSESGEG